MHFAKPETSNDPTQLFKKLPKNTKTMFPDFSINCNSYYSASINITSILSKTNFSVSLCILEQFPGILIAFWTVERVKATFFHPEVNI